jgi:parallel beta-helix repeat protein
MELIIDSSTIVFIEDDLAIIVQDGGILSIQDSLLYSYPSCSWWISAESGAQLTIKGSTLTGSGTSTHGGINVGCDNAVIDGCNISEFGGDGINIGDCTGVRIQNNVVTSCSWENIGFARTSDLIISGNKISDSGYCGIFGTGSENVIIRGNNISSTTYSGICLDRTELAEVSVNCMSETLQSSFSIEYCKNITVMNNTVTSSYGAGISSIWSTQLYLAYNDIRETVYDGIGITIHSDEVVVVGNRFHNIYSCGLISDSSNNILAYDNLMDGVHLGGINGIGGTENITAIVNTFLDCGGGLNFIDTTGIVAIGNWVNGSLYNDVHTESSEGTVYMNAFCSTGIQIGDTTLSPIEWDNGTIGNFWLDYIGRDKDGDGIGDSPYKLTLSNWDNHPIVNLDLIHEFRSSYSISAYFWKTNSTTATNTSTVPNLADQQMEALLLTNSSIQIICVAILVVILKRK